jgi:hypothetical protein
VEACVWRQVEVVGVGKDREMPKVGATFTWASWVIKIAWETFKVVTTVMSWYAHKSLGTQQKSLSY